MITAVPTVTLATTFRPENHLFSNVHLYFVFLEVGRYKWIYTGMAHGFFLEFQKVENHLEFWKKGKNSGTWKN